MKINVLYGAYFSESEINALFDKMDVLDKVYAEEDAVWEFEVSKRLQGIDTRFDLIIKQYRDQKKSIFIYGISIDKIKDEEIWGGFKKMVESALGNTFKKDIHCSILTINEDDEDY